MQAVFTRKTKGLSRLYDRKFTPSYATSRDGITCPGKCRSHWNKGGNALCLICTKRCPQNTLKDCVKIVVIPQ